MDKIGLNEQNLSTINLGRTATVVLGHMAPILANQKARIISTLMVDYRMGKLEHIKTQSLVAELCVLENLETELKGQIARAAKPLNKGDENA